MVQLFGPHSSYFKQFHEEISTKIKQNDHDFQQAFNTWLLDFQPMHPHLTPRALRELYIRHSFLALLLTIFFSRTISTTNSSERTSNYLVQGHSMIFDRDYFHWVTGSTLAATLHETLLKDDVNFSPEDLFRNLYQQLISIEERITLGEFYTPPFLARSMIEYAFQEGQVVLDPACGSGIFLVELLKSILEKNTSSPNVQSRQEALLSIFACDVNPLAVATARTNVALLLWYYHHEKLIPKIISNVQRVDFLDESATLIRSLRGKVDLVIGNPPWLVLNNLPSLEEKSRFKALARKFHIFPPPHLVSNLELSAFFLYQTKHVLKPKGHVFFVVSNGFIVGDNHARTRQFLEFDNIEIWKFSTDMFRIHSICLFAQYHPGKYRTKRELENLQVTVKRFSIIEHSKETICSSPRVDYTLGILKQISSEIYVPHAVDVNTTKAKSPRYLVRKFIPLQNKKELLPRGESPYHTRCYNGAVISPRNLLFVSIINEINDSNEELVSVVPVIENPKKRWNFNPLSELGWKHAIVEKKFIHLVVKSVDLIPFLILKYRTAFLPIEINENTGGYRLTTDHQSKGWKYFQLLDQLYRKHQKPDASLPSLWQNIDYQGKLTASRQRAPHKVVIQSGGTKVKAAVVSNPDVIIDHACFFIGTNDLKEARYLCAILNAPIITRDVNLRQAEGARGSGRSIKKRPLEICIPRFNSSLSTHVELVRQSEKMEQLVRKEVIKFLKKRKKALKSVIKIQSHVYQSLHGEFERLDNLVRNIFHVE